MNALSAMTSYYYGSFSGLFRNFTGYFGVHKNGYIERTEKD